MSRAALEAEWLQITRTVMPALAAGRRWPVRFDHCFQRILLDAVHGDRWDRCVTARPAYRSIDESRLAVAVDLARQVVAGTLALEPLNNQSLAWRRRLA